MAFPSTAELRHLLRSTLCLDEVRHDEFVRLVAIGVTLDLWRNSPVEDAHAGQSDLWDGDMMRINAFTTSRVLRIVVAWEADWDLALDDTAGLREVDVEALGDLLDRVRSWLVRPGRTVPDGRSVGVLLGAELDDYVDHVDTRTDIMLDMADSLGSDRVILLLALQAARGAEQWWGHPSWPALVYRFLAALDDPADEHWRGQREACGTEPAALHERDHARTILLRTPWQLDRDTADWIVRSGIGYLRSSLNRSS